MAAIVSRNDSLVARSSNLKGARSVQSGWILYERQVENQLLAALHCFTSVERDYDGATGLPYT